MSDGSVTAFDMGIPLRLARLDVAQCNPPRFSAHSMSLPRHSILDFGRTTLGALVAF